MHTLLPVYFVSWTFLASYCSIVLRSNFSQAAPYHFTKKVADISNIAVSLACSCRVTTATSATWSSATSEQSEPGLYQQQSSCIRQTGTLAALITNKGRYPAEGIVSAGLRTHTITQIIVHAHNYIHTRINIIQWHTQQTVGFPWGCDFQPVSAYFCVKIDILTGPYYNMSVHCHKIRLPLGFASAVCPIPRFAYLIVICHPSTDHTK